MAIAYKMIGRHICAARKQKKMTQEAVAEALGVSLNHFGKVECGDRPINLQRLSQLSLLLEIPLETLAEGSVIADDGLIVQNANTAEASDFLNSMESLTKGCSEGALRLMLRLCADISDEDKKHLFR